MPRKERLRHVMTLCSSFARNLAYYRTGWSKKYKHLLDGSDFWRAVNGNFLDMCVLEWCKLFADKKEKHHWRKVVSDPARFEAGLLRHLGLDEVAFQREIDTIRKYRDKFVAHLDLERSGRYPKFDVPKKAVWFYHAHIVNHEAEATDLAGLPVDLDTRYKQCQGEAESAYQRSAMSNCNLGALTVFGRHASGGVCSRCGAVSVFLDGKLYAMFDENGEELRTPRCAGLIEKDPIDLRAVGSDTLQASRAGIPIFQIVERGEGLQKMSAG